MPPIKCLAQVASPWSGTCASLPTCSRFLGLKFAMTHILLYVLGLRCIQFKICDSFSTVSKRIKRAAVVISPTKMELLPEVTTFIGFLWWRYCGHTCMRRWVVTLLDSGVNVDLNAFRGLEGLSAHLMIWRGKYSTKLFKEIDENHPLD
jgi:hypothetical protein